MKPYTAIGLAFLFGAAVPAWAQEPPTTLGGVQASVSRHIFDCSAPMLPTQREVGEWTGQQNFGQVYATRARLMVEVGRACQRPGATRVNLVLERRQPPAALHHQAVARVDSRPR